MDVRNFLRMRREESLERLLGGLLCVIARKIKTIFFRKESPRRQDQARNIPAIFQGRS